VWVFAAGKITSDAEIFWLFAHRNTTGCILWSANCPGCAKFDRLVLKCPAGSFWIIFFSKIFHKKKHRLYFYTLVF
jgi:hypothetical protein